MVNQEEGNRWEFVSHHNRNNSKLIKYFNFKTKAIIEIGKKMEEHFLSSQSWKGLSTGEQKP